MQIDTHHDDLPDNIDVVVVPRSHDLGDNFVVRRALPSKECRMVGPFVFLDEMGPHRFTRTSDWPPSLTCSMAKSCTATAWAPCRPSAPVKSTG
jgi:hypothetical protein